MHNNPTTCDRERIELFLQQRLSDEEQVAFELHLDDCEDCRVQLEASAAGDDIWSGVRESLTSGPFSMESEGQTSLELAESDDVSSTYDTVLKLLAPTDDERMLGRVGTYEVVGVIGSGGMGVVLKAFDAALNRYVAIKVLAPHLGSGGAARKRFSREAQAAAAVVHDNVIEIHGVADAGGLSYLVMPYVRGPSLQRRLDDDGRLKLVEILRIGMQAAAGLAAAHAQGLVHRDVKPANILLADGVERVKLTDFGLARAADDASLTRTGVIAGTPQYMSPEQARGELVDQRSDLFSLGCVLYAMCTGRAPFRAETSYAVLRRITDDEPRPIREINPDIPEWFCRIIEKLMSKGPDDRFQSAREVSELLKECLAHVQQPSSVALPKEVPLAQAATSATWLGSGNWRRRWGAIITAIALIGFGGAGAFMVATAEPSDISGEWTGEGWDRVTLNSTGPATYSGTYTDTFGKEPGTIELKWSRIERRYNGKWSEDKDRFGKISVRPDGEEIRGAWTTNRKSNINPGTPELADLLWVRPSAQKESSPSELELSPALRGLVKDRTKVQVLLVDYSERSWKWRIFLPKGVRYGWSMAFGDIPAKGLPKPTDNSMWFFPVDVEREVVVTATLKQEKDKNWTLGVKSNVENGGATMGGLSITIPEKAIPLEQGSGCVVGDTLGEAGTKTLNPGEPIELIMRRGCGKTADGEIGRPDTPTTGYMIWMQPFSAGTAQSSPQDKDAGKAEAHLSENNRSSNLKFGLVIEHTLDDITAAESTTTRNETGAAASPTKMLDVEHNKLISPPASVTDIDRAYKWANANGADFAAFTDSHGCTVRIFNGLVCLGRWEVRPRDVLEDVDHTERWYQRASKDQEPWLGDMAPEPAVAGGGRPKGGPTYYFKTHSGQIGVLQITNSEPSKFVTFRYKLLTESGKPDQNSNTQKAEKRPETAPSNLQLGEVRERTLVSIEGGKESLLQLNSGDVLDPPSDVRDFETAMQWMPAHHADLVACWDGGGQGLRIVGGLAFTPADWDASPKEIVEAINDSERQLNIHRKTIPTLEGPNKVGFANLWWNGKTTFYIKTRSGRLGVLQITDVTNDPRTVSFRYKLLTEQPPEPNQRRSGGASLSKAVADFNDKARQNPVGKDQPPLAEDEVVASIRGMADTEKQALSRSDIKELRAVAESGYLPEDWEIAETTTLDGVDGERFRAWVIQLRRIGNPIEVGVPVSERDKLFKSSGTASPIVHTIRRRLLWLIDQDGTRVDLPSGRAIPTESNVTELSAAINDFNAAHKSILDIPQPPLTEDEVVAAIHYWKAKRNDAPVTNHDFAYFQKIAEDRQVPADAQFELLTQFADDADGSELTAWSVRIRILKDGLAGRNYAFAIRDQYIRWQPSKAKEATSERSQASAEGLQTGGSSLAEPGLRMDREELTRVTIRVQYEDGHPAIGAEVTMEMQGNPERPVVVKGKADAQGVAFNRGLPYGKYEMTIKVADGGTASWSATLRDILLEFGGSYKQKVVAPTPEKRATVKVQTAFSPAGLKGLRFGNLQGPQGSYVGVIWSPEPDKQDDRFAHFPVLGNGITSAALYMTMGVTRNIKQPSGATLDWNWMRGGDFDPDYLLVTDESVIDFQELGWDGNVVFDLPKGEYFSDMPKGHSVQYFAFHDWHRADKLLSLEFPPGKLECEVRAFFGKATGEVIKALGLAPQAGRGIWLEASLNAESAWVPRGIDRSDWSPGKDIYNVLGYKTLTLKPGETQAIRVASPDPSRVDGSGTKKAK